jgi:hypothetical protein
MANTPARLVPPTWVGSRRPGFIGGAASGGRGARDTRRPGQEGRPRISTWRKQGWRNPVRDDRHGRRGSSHGDHQPTTAQTGRQPIRLERQQGSRVNRSLDDPTSSTKVARKRLAQGPYLPVWAVANRALRDQDSRVSDIGAIVRRLHREDSWQIASRSRSTA